jgi:hypothetical protein
MRDFHVWMGPRENEETVSNESLILMPPGLPVFSYGLSQFWIVHHVLPVSKSISMSPFSHTACDNIYIQCTMDYRLKEVTPG